MVSQKSKKQSTISKSLAEAEYRSVATTMTKVIWLLGLKKDRGVEVPRLINVFTNSK